MIELEANSTDDPAFLHLAGRLISGAALSNGLSTIVATHIDHWFGKRWLGFSGKLLGSAGVRSRRLDCNHSPPPFHPHRVMSTRKYALGEEQSFEFYGENSELHEYRRSEDNIYRTLVRKRLYTWYSGDTTLVDKGVVMVYVVTRTKNAAWYTAFHKTATWNLGQTVGIAPHVVHKYTELVVPDSASI